MSNSGSSRETKEEHHFPPQKYKLSVDYKATSIPSKQVGAF